MKYLVIMNKDYKSKQYSETIFEAGFIDAVGEYLEDWDKDKEEYNGFETDMIEGELGEYARLSGYDPDEVTYSILRFE